MNITVEARHMESPGSVREYVESKMAKLERLYDNIQTLHVILDLEADHTVVEIVATAVRKSTFVATHRGPDMHAAVDQCLHKVEEQIRRHKDKVRDRQGPPHSETMALPPAETDEE